MDEERGKNRNFYGVIYAICHDIRAIKTDDSVKAFCVYDTAHKNDNSHVDICQTISSRVQGSKLRFKLRQVFSKIPIKLDILFTN